MKQTSPQKVKPAPSHEIETDAVTGQPKQVLLEVNRRARTSAAVIGLALSVGAHGLVLTHSDDRAIAAEPVASESATGLPLGNGSPDSPDSQEAPVSLQSPSAAQTGSVKATEPQNAGAEAASSMKPNALVASSSRRLTEYVVQEGQTLWQIANIYGVTIEELAAINHLPTKTLLTVGQVLKVPADKLINSTIPQGANGAAPSYYGPVTSMQPVGVQNVQASPASDAEFKANQESALNRLQQKRESLRLSLNQLKSVKSEAPVTSVSAQVNPSQENIPVVGFDQPSKSADQPLPSPGLESLSQNSEQALPTVVVEPVVVSQAKSAKSSATSSDLIDPRSKSLEAENRTQLVASAVSYRVAPGDTLAAIARAHGISPTKLAKLNRISDPNYIWVNQTLLIPQSKASASTQVETISSPATVAALPSQLPDTATPSSNSSFDGSAKVVPAAVEVPVANVPLVRSNLTTQDTASNLRSDYVQSLRSEIVKLRDKYRISGLSTQTETKIAVASPASASVSEPSLLPTRINPEYRPSKGLFPTPNQAPDSKAQYEHASMPTSSAKSDASVLRSQPQKVAVAPTGSETYAPLLPSAVGQMVSPDLPPLGSVDAYVPNGSGKFNGYIWPARGLLTSGYGWRWGRMHRGIDIAAPIGTPVVAAADGVVSYAGWNSGGYGNLVEVTHADGSVTLYAHNNRILVQEGQQVAQGQQIAEMGSTGYSTGPHSHFEVHLPGQGAVNPMAYLPRGGGA